MVGAIQYGSEKIRYEVCFLPSRQTLGIEVHPDQRVVIRAPVGCSEEAIADRVKKRASWISRQIADFQRYNPRTPQRQYIGGETHLYLGRQYSLKINAGKRTSITMTRHQLEVELPGKPNSERVKATLHRWYLDRARQVFDEVLEECLIRFEDHRRPRLIIRTMQSRWGSLSASGNMTLNSSLIRAPRACIEYVVIHELCHLQYRDHDARFLKLLGRMMPDWVQRKQRLESALL